MGYKEIFLSTLVAIITGIFIVHYEHHFFEAPPPPETKIQPATSSEEPRGTEKAEKKVTPQVTISKMEDISKPVAAENIEINTVPTQKPPLNVQVKLWLDKIGKTQFSPQDKVTLFYQVQGDIIQQPIYLTIINTAPNGEIYPYLKNRLVNMGKLYSLPEQIVEGQNVSITTEVGLSVGREKFIAIATRQPINWQEFATLNESSSQFLGMSELSVQVEEGG